MALTQYRIDGFSGIHQGWSENTLDSGSSPDACNMDTENGDLSVARGFVRHLAQPLPEEGAISRLYVWNRAKGRRFVAAVGNALFAITEGEADWSRIHTYETAAAEGAQYDFLVLKIASDEALLIANGLAQMVKWDGDTAHSAAPFGSAEQLSAHRVNFVELYFNRLFAAGDPEHPSRLYWSMAPGGTRTVEDWGVADESENVSGGHVEIGGDSDPITGLFALSNQLLIFKRDSVYRLLGDRPGNYRVTPLNAAMRQPVHTAVIRYGDVLFFLTDGGMYYYDGQTVRRQADADKVKRFLAHVDVTRCMSAACRDKLYFAVREHADAAEADAVLVYDLSRGTYMVRRGFTASDLDAAGGVLYLVDGSRHVNRFDEGDDYAGVPISAYWETPMTDLGQKMANKQLRELYLRGTGGRVGVEAKTGVGTRYFERIMPEKDEDIMEIPLGGEGRAFSLRILNVAGSRFTIRGGLEVLSDLQRRTL